MKASSPLWLGLWLGFVAWALAVALSSPRWRCELGWALASMARPTGRPGLRLQR